MTIDRYYAAQIENHSRDGVADSECMAAEPSTDDWRHDRMRSPILPLLGEKGRWLTFGDGRGTDAAWLIKKGQTVLCTDIQDVHLKKSNAAGLISDYRAANAEALPFGDDAFDWGFCKEAYHHMPRAPVAFYEMLRVVKNGLVLIEPAPRQARNFFGALVLAVLDRVRPIRPEFEFEPSGNYVFKLSIADVQQMLLGIGLRCFAYRSINDFYIEGVEKERPPGVLKRFCERKILVRDLVDDWLGLHRALMVFVVFKRDPLALDGLKQSGFEVVNLPTNPYLP